MFKRPKLLIAGLVIVVFGIAVLLANSAERSEQVADELVEATAVLPENEGKLVIVSGVPQLADGLLTDEEAGLTVDNAVYYGRTPLQKVYALEKREVVVDYGEDKRSDDDDIKETQYYVVKQWIVANRSRDEEVGTFTERYKNPAPVNLGVYQDFGELRLGGFRVSYADVVPYLHVKKGRFTQEELRQACGEFIARSELGLEVVADEEGNGMLSNGDEIGDVHVRFAFEKMEGAEEVTFVGRQRGDELVFEDDDLVSESERMQTGKVSREEFLDSISSEDASSRTIGYGSLALGLVIIALSVFL